ncbi:MAG TPA: DUF177 domain-containing protein [Gemmatimonadaceae bacterium]|nr:DUF177 domain-containing protein [Gemmatimonadaceae bacterium]
MLRFDIRSLESKAAMVDDELTAGDAVWQEGDPLPAEPVRVSGRLSSAGSGRVLWSGRLAGTARVECRRCLTDLVVPVSENVQLLFAEAGDDEVDDPDVYLFDPRARELDLRPAVREQWLLAAPAFSLCREACLGLCPHCGADRNTESCSCSPAADARETSA